MSAIKRLDVYTDVYGLTTIRFYSAVFWLFVVFVYCGLLWFILKQKSISKFLWYCWYVFLLTLLGLNFVIPDRLIVWYNLTQIDRELDIEYMTELSADSWRYVLEDNNDYLSVTERCELISNYEKQINGIEKKSFEAKLYENSLHDRILDESNECKK